MNEHDFWYREESLFLAYQKAYYKRLHNTAYTFGMYFNNSLSANLYNLFREKGKSAEKYIDKPIDVFAEMENKKIINQPNSAQNIFNAWATIKSK